MDTSETYIKMRIAAIPELGQGTPYLDTFCAMPDLRSFVDRKGDFYVWIKEEPNWCQLERQDQLQEMVGIGSIYDVWVKLETYVNGGLLPPFLNQQWSMEQLWLAFYMNEKYNKVWDGQKWKSKRD